MSDEPAAPQFGRPEPGVAYRDRPAAFGIAEDGGRIAIVKVTAEGLRPWFDLPGGAIARGRILEQHGSSYLRGALSQYDPQRIIQDAGWHFTSMGSPERIARKLQSYAHHERAHRGEDHFRRHLLDLQDGVFEAGWERQEIDETFPSYIRRNREALEDFIL